MNTLSVNALRELIGGDRILTEPADVDPFLLDWRKRYRGRAMAVAQPRSTAEVAALVKWCAAHRVPMVPQGGNTGLCGGATPDPSGTALLISLKRMNQIRAIDAINNTITVEAGCVLADVQTHARAHQRLFALSLGAEGSCTIGGNLSTNAGGVQVLRYGNSRELCLGLEVVTADGEIWNGLSGLRKDNTGYDLRDLFIGAEGTLGIITAAVMKTFALPAAQCTALAALDSPDAALRLLDCAQNELAASLTAFELMSDYCLDLVDRHIDGAGHPFDKRHRQYVLLESSDAEGQAHALARFDQLLAGALERGIIADAVVAESLAQRAKLWKLRESIPEAQTIDAPNIKHDVSIPISRIGEFIERCDARLAAAFPGVRNVTFGHLGDGNLHYNVSAPAGADATAFVARQPEVSRVVHDCVAEFGGSISAEHGLGQLKREEIRRYKSPVALRLMGSIKQALDPHNLCNPGKVI